MGAKPKTFLNPADRIKSKYIFDKETGCWNWDKSFKGVPRLKQYGHLSVNGKNWIAHRYSYIVFIGDIEPGMFICHKCDNPRCVNPMHLFQGTRQDNVDDRERKGRNNPTRGERNYNTILKQYQVDEIRAKFATGRYTYRSLSRFYGLKCHKSIIDIIREVTWKPTSPPKSINP